MGFLGLDYIYHEMSLRKVCGECFSFNTASIRFHERLGFQREGYFVKHIYRNGQYEDIIRFALFNDEWSRKRKEIGRVIFGEEVADDLRNCY